MDLLFFALELFFLEDTIRVPYSSCLALAI